MPIDQTIDKTTGIMIRTVTGEISLEEIKSSFEKSIKRLEFNYGFPLLWDFRKANLLKIKDGDLKKFSNYYETQLESHPGFKIAYVAADDFQFEFLELVKVFYAKLPVEIQIFKDFEDAAKWLMQR